MMMIDADKRWVRILTAVCQYILGALFVFSGIVKGIDPTGTAIKIGEYFSSMGLGSHSQLDMFLSVSLCLGETLLGAVVLSGLYRRVVPILMWITMLFMTGVTLYIVIANPVADCGCFGDALKISNGATFGKNIFLLICATILLLYKQNMIPMRVAVKHNFLIIIVMALVIAQFIYANIVHLPVIDFRPYKVGLYLPEATGRIVNPEDQPKYEYKFVYAKDGREKTFTMDQLSQIDSTWTYVKDETTLLSKGKEPAATDFILTSQAGVDLTDSVISPTGRCLLLISTDITGSSSSMPAFFHRRHLISKRNDLSLVLMVKALSTIAQHHHAPLYWAYGQASDTTTLAEMRRALADEVIFAHIDMTTAKTIIRSSPGLLVIDKGTIMRKVAVGDIPLLIDQQSFQKEPFAADPNHLDTVLGRFAPMVVVALILLVGSLSMRAYDYRRRRDPRDPNDEDL